MRSRHGKRNLRSITPNHVPLPVERNCQGWKNCTQILGSSTFAREKNLQSVLKRSWITPSHTGQSYCCKISEEVGISASCTLDFLLVLMWCFLSVVADDLAERIADVLVDEESEDLTWAGQFKKSVAVWLWQSASRLCLDIIACDILPCDGCFCLDWCELDMIHISSRLWLVTYMSHEYSCVLQCHGLGVRSRWQWPWVTTPVVPLPSPFPLFLLEGGLCLRPTKVSEEYYGYHGYCYSLTSVKLILSLSLDEVTTLPLYNSRNFLGAWPTFVISLLMIGALTALVEQVQHSHGFSFGSCLSRVQYCHLEVSFQVVVLYLLLCNSVCDFLSLCSWGVCWAVW